MVKVKHLGIGDGNQERSVRCLCKNSFIKKSAALGGTVPSAHRLVKAAWLARTMRPDSADAAVARICPLLRERVPVHGGGRGSVESSVATERRRRRSFEEARWFGDGRRRAAIARVERPIHAVGCGDGFAVALVIQRVGGMPLDLLKGHLMLVEQGDEAF